MQIKSQMVEEIKTLKPVSSVQQPVNSNTYWIVNRYKHTYKTTNVTYR